MAERLRKVAQQLSRGPVDLFRQETEVVHTRRRPLEHLARPLYFSAKRQGVGQPKGTEQEGAFLALQPVRHPVAIDPAEMVGEPLGDCGNCGPDSAIVCRQESDDREQQGRCVERVTADATPSW